MNGEIINGMSVDVEDYFQVSAFERHIARDQWDTLPRRVEKNTERVLALFDDVGVKSTFFMLGWVAERHPGLVRQILEQGHELASHGYSHIRATQQQPDQFRQDVTRTRNLLEDIGGVPVRGYRAASYSIVKNNIWALDILEQAGYEYSSSVYPIHHDLYGIPDAPRFAFHPNNSRFVEIPISTVRYLNRNFPCGGGGFFRLFPYQLSRWAIDRVNRTEKKPTIFYFHPWEVDPKQPRQNGLSLKSRFRHYLNLEQMEYRLRRLLSDFKWDRMDRVFLNKS